MASYPKNRASMPAGRTTAPRQAREQRQVYRASQSRAQNTTRRSSQGAARSVGATSQPRGQQRRQAPQPQQRPVTQQVRRTTQTKRKQESKVRMFYKHPGAVNGGFVATLAILQAFGLIMLFSASYATALYKFGNSYEYFGPQMLYACVGFVAMWIASRVDYHWIRKWSWTLYFVVLALLVVVLFMPPIKGCRRWINISHFPTIQVSEIAKFSLILLLAHLFARYEKRIEGKIPGAGAIENFKLTIVLPGMILLPILILLYLEPHNSAMILMCCITASIMLVGGALLRWFFSAAGVAVAGAAVMLILRGGYVQERLQGWLDPFSDMKDSTLQTGQSLYTIGSGGLFGVGIGNSVQKHMWLPEAQNDFIFAVLCEELGFVGAAICILLFLLLIIQGIIIAKQAPDRFGSLLVVGCIAQIGFQFIFNIAVVTNTIPNTGISLPFFSSGGTSLMLLLGQMGIVLSVCRAGNKKRAEDRAAREEQKEEQRRKEEQDPYARFR